MRPYPGFARAVLARTVFMSAAALAPLLLAASAFADVTVYSNDFSTDANGFSSSMRSTTPNTSTRANETYLGNFGNSTVSLSLAGLAAHTSTTISFDLYAINTLDGNGPAGGGADPYNFTVSQNGGAAATLLSTNFANYQGGNTQSFGGANGMGGYLTGGTYAPQTGATEVNTLYGNDSIYHFTFTFADTSSNLAFNFINGQNQDSGDESMGYDNVVVTTNAGIASVAPEPGTIALGLTGLPFLGAVLAHRRRQRLRG